MNRLAELLRELKNHVGETYNTLDKGSTGKNIRHDANALAKTLKSAFPMLEKDPQYVGAEDLINSGLGVMPLSTKLPATAFSKAHALAQKNAALPIEKGGLGLHPDNTAMERARALGFDVANPVYHGTGSSNIDELIPSSGGEYGGGVYLTDRPGTANQYAAFSKGDDKNIIPLFAKTEKTLETSDRNIPRGLGVKGLKKKGYDSVLGKNTSENQLVILDPKNIRSRFAAFDPMQKNSANILASLLLGIGLAKDEK